MARIAADSIRFPMMWLYMTIYNLINTETNKMTITAGLLSMGAEGEKIFSAALFNNSNPIRKISMETTKPEMYSILPCPKGWSGSGFDRARRNPINTMTEEPASDRLLNASAMMATDPLRIPANNLMPNNTMFKTMPIMPQSMP